MRILAVCGSLQARSSNLSLLLAAQRLAPAGVHVVLFGGLRDLPHFDLDLAEQEQTLDAVAAWRTAIEQSDALLIACPEYGFSLPGVLKNGIDWVIGTGELERKVVGVTASTSHPDRGRGGLKALCDTLNAVSARIVGGEPIVRRPHFEDEVRDLLRDIAGECRASQQELEDG